MEAQHTSHRQEISFTNIKVASTVIYKRNLHKQRVEQNLPPQKRLEMIQKREWNKRKENIERLG